MASKRLIQTRDRSADENPDDSSYPKRLRRVDSSADEDMVDSSSPPRQLAEPLRRIIQKALEAHDPREIAATLRDEFLKVVLQAGITKAKEDNRQVINGDDLWFALMSLGLTDAAHMFKSKGFTKAGGAKAAGQSHLTPGKKTGDLNCDMPFEPFKKIYERMMQPEISAGVPVDPREAAEICALEFIRLVLIEGNKKAGQDKRQTITKDDLFSGVEALGFKDFADRLRSKDSEAEGKPGCADGSGPATSHGLGQPGSSSQQTEETPVQKPATLKWKDGSDTIY